MSCLVLSCPVTRTHARSGIGALGRGALQGLVLQYKTVKALMLAAKKDPSINHKFLAERKAWIEDKAFSGSKRMKKDAKAHYMF